MAGASPATTIYASPVDPFVYSSGWACPSHATHMSIIACQGLHTPGDTSICARSEENVTLFLGTTPLVILLLSCYTLLVQRKSTSMLFAGGSSMSQQLRILVVEDDEQLKQSIVNSLQKDGYSVQGVATGAEAIHILWADEQNLVIGDKQLPDADGFDLLQWIRTYCPRTRMIVLAATGSPGTRTQALEYGAAGYLEKPIDLHLLKVEVRRLLQQTGFTASLASFDLLDVIQIVNMSRKSIALFIHTGLEEQGLLGFRAGELIWAEYGTLRGEEAFFALAAHKNGTVTQQPWNDQIAPNVKQPLARLIMQALQYRSKYAGAQQLSGEYEAVSAGSALRESNAQNAKNAQSSIDKLLVDIPEDDRPFTYVAESPVSAEPVTPEASEWWQEASRVPGQERSGKVGAVTGNAGSSHSGIHKTPVAANGSSITPSTVHKTAVGQRSDLPSWLMDQPTQFEMQALRPSSLTGTGQFPSAAAARPTPAEWQPSQPAKPASDHTGDPLVSLSKGASGVDLGREAPAEWRTPLQNGGTNEAPFVDKSGASLQSLSSRRQTDDLFAHHTHDFSDSPSIQGDVTTTNNSPGEHTEFATHQEQARGAVSQPRQSKRNYPALVSALQTLGYSLSGFVASAVVSIDGQPIAQVAVEDLDISPLCSEFSALLRGALLTLNQGNWGRHEDTIITSTSHHIVLRVLGSESQTFQVLITTRESDPVESLEVMANVEGAIVAAL